MESTNVATLPLVELSMVTINNHIITSMNTAPLVSLGLLCDGGYTTTLDKQITEVQNNVQ